MMKYELEPWHRNIPKAQMLQDLQRVAKELGRPTVTRREYAEKGTYNPSTIHRAFGSWFKALTEAGLAPSRSAFDIPHHDLITDLQ
jgi:hypothetical protein